MKAVLVMFKADGKRREFPLKPGTHVIGRQKTCKLRVPLPSVSRRHAELTVSDEGGVSVRDLGSSNGTFRNGSRVEEAVLEPGDELRIGPLDLILADAAEADEVKPPKAGAAAGSGVAAAAEEPEGEAADSGAFLLGEEEDDAQGLDLSDSVHSPNPLDASGSGGPAPLALDGDDDDADDTDDAARAGSASAGASPPAGAKAPAAPVADEEDDEDLDDLLANFGKSDDDESGGSDEFDFLADVEILDDDAEDK